MLKQHKVVKPRTKNFIKYLNTHFQLLNVIFAYITKYFPIFSTLIFIDTHDHHDSFN